MNHFINALFNNLRSLLFKFSVRIWYGKTENWILEYPELTLCLRCSRTEMHDISKLILRVLDDVQPPDLFRKTVEKKTSLSKDIKSEQFKVDLIIKRCFSLPNVNFSGLKNFQGHRSSILPLWIDHEIALGDFRSRIRNSRLRRLIRVRDKSSNSVAVSHSIEKENSNITFWDSAINDRHGKKLAFKRLYEFYKYEYLPFISQRHGEGAYKRTFFSMAFNYFTGRLKLLEINDCTFAIIENGNSIRLIATGIRIKDKLKPNLCFYADRNHGFMKYCMFILLSELEKKGYESILLGGSRPFDVDGLTTFKRLWGGKIKAVESIGFFKVESRSKNGSELLKKMKPLLAKSIYTKS